MFLRRRFDATPMAPDAILHRKCLIFGVRFDLHILVAISGLAAKGGCGLDSESDNSFASQYPDFTV